MNLLEAIDEIINETKDSATTPEDNPPPAEKEKPLAAVENDIPHQLDKTAIGVYWLQAFEEWLIFSLEDDLKAELQKRGVRLYRGWRFGQLVLITQDARFADPIGKTWSDFQFMPYNPNHEDKTRCLCGGEIWLSDMFCHRCYTWHGEE